MFHSKYPRSSKYIMVIWFLKQRNFEYYFIQAFNYIYVPKLSVYQLTFSPADIHTKNIFLFSTKEIYEHKRLK